MDRQPDLHLHSSASDGTLDPEALVALASREGLEMIALTDHDTIAGLAAAAGAARVHGIDFVAGVEISCSWAGVGVHVLGLGIDADCPALTAGLAGLDGRRRARAAAIAARLEKRRIAGALEGVRALAGEAAPTRTHFARWLVAAGLAPTPAAAHKRYLARGRPAHVAGDWTPLAEAIGWIGAAGGVAVLAHPARCPLSARKLRLLVAEFAAAGGGALEVVSGPQPAERTRFLAELATAHRLMGSRGSDFHGPEQRWLAPGRMAALPPTVTPVWGVLGAAGRARRVRV